MLRVGEMVRHAITESFQRNQIMDPLLEKTYLSVTQVIMSPDLSNATAYISPIGVSEPQPVVDALNRHAKYIRGTLGPALRQMRTMPLIRFRLDTSFDNYAKIDMLLRSPEVARDLGRLTSDDTADVNPDDDFDVTSDVDPDVGADG